MTETETEKRTQVRMPADVHKWLTFRAQQNNRSMNGELVDILKKIKEGEEQKAAFERGSNP